MNTPQIETHETRTPQTPQTLFERERLPFPPVPKHLAASLQQQGQAWFSTSLLQATPYDMDHFLAEIEDDSGLPEYAVVGFDGHGTNSWAAHYYLVSDAVALFIQLPWGGAYLDVEPARAEIADLFGWAAELQSKLQIAHERRLIPDGWRLQVAASRFGQAGWRWLAAGRDNAALPWNSPGGMKATIQQALDDILGGKQVLHETLPASDHPSPQRQARR
jgi:hypothetical protein